MLQLSDKQDDADFTEQDEVWIRELAALTGGTLDALRASAGIRADLVASRARVVAAADDTRRRIQRDLHDGSQQRLVSLALALRAAEATVPPEVGEVHAELSRAASELGRCHRGSAGDLTRDTSCDSLQGRPRSGARRRSPAERPSRCSWRLESTERLPERVEVAAYYVVSETLTNAAKHSHASVVHIDVETVEARAAALAP